MKVSAEQWNILENFTTNKAWQKLEIRRKIWHTLTRFYLVLTD